MSERKKLNMNENENGQVVIEQPEQQPSEIDLALEIQKIKAESVTKEEYNRLKAEKNDLLRKVINGEKIADSGAPIDNNKTVQDYRAKLEQPDLTNLEYIEAALELRGAVLEKDGIDIFADADGGHAESAEKVATVLQDCVDQADGDSAVFTTLLQSRTANDPVKPNNKKPR